MVAVVIALAALLSLEVALVAEIEILLEVLDTKYFYYQELKNNFWN